MYIHTPQEAMYGFLYTFLQMGQNTFIIFDLSPASTTTSCMVCMQGNDNEWDELSSSWANLADTISGDLEQRHMCAHAHEINCVRWVCILK